MVKIIINDLILESYSNFFIALLAGSFLLFLHGQNRMHSIKHNQAQNVERMIEITQVLSFY